jgi:flagellar biosynthesis/type III secretory pathway chaperone
MMQEVVKKVILLMEKENQLYNDLNEICDKCTAALVNIKMQEVEQLTWRQQPLIETILRTSKQRLSLLQELVRMLEIPEQEANSKNISKKLPHPFDKEFLKVSEELKKSISQALDKNKLNKFLIDQSLHHINHFFDIISGQAEANITYSKKGIHKRWKANGLVNRVI